MIPLLFLLPAGNCPLALVPTGKGADSAAAAAMEFSMKGGVEGARREKAALDVLLVEERNAVASKSAAPDSNWRPPCRESTRVNRE